MMGEVLLVVGMESESGSSFRSARMEQRNEEDWERDKKKIRKSQRKKQSQAWELCEVRTLIQHGLYSTTDICHSNILGIHP